MPDIYDELLQKTFLGYQQGSAKNHHISSQVSDDIFSETLQTLISRNLPLCDQLILRRYDNAREQGLLAARQGQLAVAQHFFEEARTPLEMGKLSNEGKLLHQSFLEQSEAYLDYRQNNFEQVYDRTDAALGLDVVLESEYGYDILLMHRIQLLHNLVRTEARRMNFEKAIILASKLLNYLDGKLENLPTPHPWSFESLTHQPQELVCGMFAQIASEVALILTVQSRNQAHHLFKIVTEYMHLSANNHQFCHSHAHSWFLAKLAITENNIDSFLQRAANFLAEGIADTPLLWYSTILDWLHLCSRFGRMNLSQEIATDVIVSNYLPNQMIPLFKKHSHPITN